MDANTPIITVVDDDPLTRAILRNTLEAAGLLVAVFATFDPARSITNDQ